MEPEHQITFGPFRLEGTPGRLWRGDQVIPLRPRSLAMLRYLAEHPGRLVTKAEVQQQVWAGTHVTDSVKSVTIHWVWEACYGVGRGGGASTTRASRPAICQARTNASRPERWGCGPSTGSRAWTVRLVICTTTIAWDAGGWPSR